MARTSRFTPVLPTGCASLVAATALRATFGLLQLPIATAFGWPRADFSLAIAIQGLAWDIGAPLSSAMADKPGDRWAVLPGSVFQMAGLVLPGFATMPLAHQGLAILIGFGIAGMGSGVVQAVVGRASGDANGSMTMAIASAAGPAGPVFGPPLAPPGLPGLPGLMPGQPVFPIFAAMIGASMPVLPVLRAPAKARRAEPAAGPWARPDAGHARSVLCADLSGLFQLRLSAGPFSARIRPRWWWNCVARSCRAACWR